MQELERPLPPITVATVGAAFPNADGTDRRIEISLCKPGEPVVLRPEPENPYDEHAVAVLSMRGVQLGYVNSARAVRVSAIMRSGREVQAVFQAETPFGAWVRIAFDGAEPTLPDIADVRDEEPDWYPDEVWPDE